MGIKLAEKKCTGCTACTKICPKHCISMKINNEGFTYPEIDESICINCGLCEKTCPVLHKPSSTCIKTTAYAAYSTDIANRLSSSSGGIFSILAEYVLDHNGIVYGAAFDEKMNVHHIGIDSKNELEKLRGSKYVQSDLENIFLDVKSNLESNRLVLFSGVICQIAGLKAYLKKEYSNLLTIDVLCHGVPSPKLWNRYVIELENKYGSNIEKIYFRNKTNGWKSYSLLFEFSNKEEYLEIFNKNSYMQMFLGNISLRPSCYDCHFNNIDRLSDITLGDCWGIERTIPNMDDDKGTSVVLVHTEKGNEYFNKIMTKMKVCESDVDVLLPPNSGGRHSVSPHPKRNKFFRLLNNGESINNLSKMVRVPIYKRIIRFCLRAIKKILRILGIVN